MADHVPPSTPSDDVAADLEPSASDTGLYRLQERPPPPEVEPVVVESAGRSRRGSIRKPAAARRGDVWVLMGCNLIVFASSVCIMVLELTASRLIAKHVGSSLYTWTSVIGVVLAGITVGNYIGGWLADRFAPRRLLGWLFLTSSVLSFSVLWLDQLSRDFSRPEFLDWPAWVLVLVAGIFLLPSISLGTISPVAASLALSRSLKTGMTVGNVYAWGALGSIVGTFLTGFWLIDAFGTKAIVAITAASLAAIGVTVAAGRWVFRAAVVLGWLQFVFFMGLAATATEQTGWLGSDLGGQLHELGMTLRLRDDAPGEYHDESNYSYINVADDVEDGDRIKYLKLDKLIHSYWNPSEPTALYYDYERVYAAVTERAASGRDELVQVSLAAASIPDEWDLASRVPDGVRYASQDRTLSVRGAMTVGQRDALLAIAPTATWWEAVNELHRRTTTSNWGGFDSVSLDAMPAGVVIPERLSMVLQYDRALQLLNAYGPVTGAIRTALIDAAPHTAYYRAVHELYGRSRQVSTLFIGGGGFVFPRWIEVHFPENPRIDVAEIDPAVKRAVQRELGLPPDGETAVNTFIGDARNFVDDRLRRNAELLASEGGSPVLYDFIYGDAFNDFSVPWHLTTREFSEKIRRLLTADGLYLVNIIDIYPRTEYPGRTRGGAEIAFRGRVPAGVFRSAIGGEWTAAGDSFGTLEARSQRGELALRYRGEMSDDVYAELRDLAMASENDGFLDAVRELYDRSRALMPLPTALPQALLPESTALNVWQSGPPPYEWLEVKQVRSQPSAPAQGFVLGLRGAMTETMREQLTALAPQDREWTAAVAALEDKSRHLRPGRFLGSYVRTAAEVFPNVYVFSSETGLPHDDRDTFVIACSMRPLDFADLNAAGGHWDGSPFARLETPDAEGSARRSGHMESLLGLSRGLVLTDDYAPVDNLLSPVFTQQD